MSNYVMNYIYCFIMKNIFFYKSVKIFLKNNARNYFSHFMYLPEIEFILL